MRERAPKSDVHASDDPYSSSVQAGEKLSITKERSQEVFDRVDAEQLFILVECSISG